MKIRHKYLEELDATYDYDLGKGFKSWKRKRKYWKEYKKTGVNPMDCWSLDNTFYCWLYEHLCRYIDDADSIVDLTYQKFTYKDKEYTLIEMINLLKDYLKEIIPMDIDLDNYNRYCELKDNIFDIWKLIIDDMWW